MAGVGQRGNDIACLQPDADLDVGRRICVSIKRYEFTRVACAVMMFNHHGLAEIIFEDCPDRAIFYQRDLDFFILQSEEFG